MRIGQAFPPRPQRELSFGVDAGEFSLGDTRRSKYHADCAVCMRCGCLHDGPQRLTFKVPRRWLFPHAFLNLQLKNILQKQKHNSWYR